MNAFHFRADAIRSALQVHMRASSTALALCTVAFAPALQASPLAPKQFLAQSKDLGAADLASRISITIGVNGANETGLDAAVAALYEPDSPTYHQWISDSAMASYGPTPTELSEAKASLAAQGLSVDETSDDGRMIKVSGSISAMQAAFATAIHQWTLNGKKFYRAVGAPRYQGAHSDLFSGVSGFGGIGMQPQISQQLDFTTGLPVPAVAPQAGTDPLASFTTECFGPIQTAHIKGIHVYMGLTPVTADWKGPTYRDFQNVLTRPACGYTAEQLVHHYGFDDAHALGWNGEGQTIVIVDAYGSTTALADLNAFSIAMKLPTMDASTFRTVYPEGVPAVMDSGWALETTLDIEWAHAFAPKAKIVVVASLDANDPELSFAVQYAVDHRLGNVISNSYGLAESLSDIESAKLYNHVFKRAAARGIAVNVATGDSGDNGLGTPLGAASVPADSPFATAIGGTSIGIPSANGPVESAWGINVTALGSNLNPLLAPVPHDNVEGSGGGESVFFKKPRFESKLPGLGRQLPDVSAVADPQTGAIIVFTDPGSGVQYFQVIGGTSLSTPVFSAMWAIADQVAGQSLGQAAPTIARLPAFAVRDVLPINPGKSQTSGSITVGALPTVQYTGAQLLDVAATQPAGWASFLFSGLSYQDGIRAYDVLGFGTDTSLMATPGWDNATGYGVPNGILFIDAARIFARLH